MSKIRLATVGTGYFSQFQYAAWQRIPSVELVAVCNRSIDGANKIANQYGVGGVYTEFSRMLEFEQPDLIDIITPPETHLEFIREAVKHRTHIICQKPFCTSMEEAKLATEMAKDAGVQLVIHENFRFQPWYRHIHTQLQQAKLGHLYQAYFRFRPGDGQGVNAYMDRQPYFQKMKKFLVHETAIHWVDTFRYLFGEVSAVYAQLRRLNSAIAGEDSGLIIFDFQSGMQAVFDGNRLADHIAENRRLTMGEMIIEGASASLMLDGQAEITIRQHGSNTLEKQEYSWQNAWFGGDCVYRLQRHVIDHLIGDGSIENTAEDYLRNLAVEEAIYLSAETNAKVEVIYE